MPDARSLPDWITQEPGKMPVPVPFLCGDCGRDITSHVSRKETETAVTYEWRGCPKDFE